MEQAPDGKIKILYVDDQPNNLLAFRAYFRRNPQFEIYTSKSGNQDLELLQNQVFHVVISDQKMPDMTGGEFIEQVGHFFPNIVSIIVTGQRELDMIEAAKQDGKIFDWHHKPRDLIYLEKMILNAYDEYCTKLK